LYQYGKRCSYFILILSGEATLELGKDKLEFPVPPLTNFGVNALLRGCKTVDDILSEETISKHQQTTTTDEITHQATCTAYVPDFSLRVDEKCVYMRVDRVLWRNAVIRSHYEKTSNKKAENDEELETGFF
jgi:hypothetical protein